MLKHLKGDNMPESLPIFVINLKDSHDRMARIAAALTREGLPFERVEAVDLRGRDPVGQGGYDPRRARRRYGRVLTAGEVGCYLSHVACLRRLTEGDAPAAVVLEDDAEIPVGFGAALRAVYLALADVPQWGVANLGNMPKLKYTRPLGISVSGRDLVRAEVLPVWSHVMLWRRAGAGDFLASCATPSMPVDHAFTQFATWRGTGVAAIPPLAGQSGMDSDIDAGGQRPVETWPERLAKWRRKWWYKYAVLRRR